MDIPTYLEKLKLSLRLIGLVVVANLISGAWTVRYAYNALKQQKQQDELVIAENIALEANESLSKAQGILAALAADPAISAPDAQRQRNILTLSTRASEILDGIAVLDLHGRILTLDDYPPDTRPMLPADRFKELVEPIATRGHDVSFRAFRTGASGEAAMAISLPIVRNGRRVAVLSGVILIEHHTFGGIKRFHMGDTGNAYLVDNDGRIIIHPSGEKFLADASTLQSFKAFLQRRRGVAELVNQEGIPILAAFAPIASTGWGVIVRQHTVETYAYAKQIIYYLMVAIVLNTIVVAAIGLFLARTLAEPLIALAEDLR